MGIAKSSTDIDTCARVIIARGGEQAIVPRVKKMLDGVFADEWMRANHWPWAQIAKNPARYLAPPAPSTKRGEGYVKLQANPGEFGSGDFGDDDIPTADGPQKVIGYGT